MKTKRCGCALAVLLGWLATAAGPAGAQSSTYAIHAGVFGSGAATCSGPAHRIIGSLGQPFIGVTADSAEIHLVGFWYRAVETVTTVEEDAAAGIPQDFRLEQNYPNPFNPRTTILFAVPKPAHVSLRVYNLLGQLVAVLVDEELAPGTYRSIFDARKLPGGVYFYVLNGPGIALTRKFVLVR
ncbi:MAG: T9SS C-terminal target domain-containing protein [Calditrichaeota bacterium]|nr:MAG: T9SS C-terminal target domain-containing protein [Calditrichota bacterium]